MLNSFDFESVAREVKMRRIPDLHSGSNDTHQMSTWLQTHPNTKLGQFQLQVFCIILYSAFNFVGVIWGGALLPFLLKPALDGDS